MPEHRLRGQTNLREQLFRAAAREIKHRFGLGIGRDWVADDRDIVLVFDVEQGPRGFLRQTAREFLVDEMNHLLLDRRRADRRARRRSLFLGHTFEQIMGQALGLEADADHRRARQLDGLWIGRVEHEHRRRIARPEALLPHLAQQIAHIHRHFTEVDIDRAWTQAFMADGAMVGDILELLPMLDRDAAPGLLLVQKGLDQQRSREDLVARRIEQIGARHMGGADRLAFAATQAILDAGRDRADVALLHDQRLMAHQPETRRVGIGQVGKSRLPAQQLALVEAPFRVDFFLVAGEPGQLFVGQVFELGNADAMFA